MENGKKVYVVWVDYVDGFDCTYRESYLLDADKGGGAFMSFEAAHMAAWNCIKSIVNDENDIEVLEDEYGYHATCTTIGGGYMNDSFTIRVVPLVLHD